LQSKWPRPSAGLGTKVSVVQRSGQILTKEDKDMADEVMQVLTSEGVDFHLKALVLGVKDLGKEKEVSVKDKEGKSLP
jgi:pyruvate/2-oxoglutarate dehydrogenase complex dihydrolipoamide dehydrogenase (E3) component